MVTDKLVDEVREKIKAGLGEGVIKSSLMMEGWPLADIESVLNTEMKGATEVGDKEQQKKRGGGVWVSVFGVLFVAGMVFGGAKLAMYLRDKTEAVDGTGGGQEISTSEVVPTETLTPTPSIKGLSEIQAKQAVPLIAKDLLSEDLYSDAVEGYRIRPPKGWQIDTSGKLGAPVFFFGPEAIVGEGEIYRANMNIQVGRANGNGLGNYVDYYIKRLESNLTNLIVSNERKVVITGRDVYMANLKFNQGKLILSGEVMVMVDRDKAFVITGLADDKAWEGVSSIIEMSMYTFNLL